MSGNVFEGWLERFDERWFVGITTVYMVSDFEDRQDSRARIIPSVFNAALEVMLASDIQSPIITSIGSFAWLAASIAIAWRRSVAAPEHPV